MHLSFTDKKKIRKSFGKLENILNIPDLIEVQRQSYNSFLEKIKKVYQVWIKFLKKFILSKISPV